VSLILAIISLSIAFQVIAAIMALRMIRLTGICSVWLLLSCAFMFMGIRRVVTFKVIYAHQSNANLTPELLGLFASMILVYCMWRFGPMFTEMNRSRSLLIDRQEELSRINHRLEDEIDQRRIMAEMLEESEARYRVVADFSHDWDYWVGADRTYKYISPYCKQVSGYDRADFYRDPKLLSRIIHPDDRELFRSHVHEVFEGTGNPAPIDFRIITADGRVRWIGHVCRRIVGAGEISLGQRASNRDITDRKRTESELFEKSRLLEREVSERKMIQEVLAEKKQELEMLNLALEQRISETVTEMRQKDQVMISQSRLAAMGEMIGNIAHQWRQPLNTLGLVLANINDAYRFNELNDEFMKKSLSDCNRMIRKMSSTINDFSNFFRPDKESVAFSVRSQINEAMTLVEAGFIEKNITINLDGSNDFTVFGFPNEYSQVIVNLLVNAKDAILHSDVKKGRIAICLNSGDGRGSVTVSDNGGGIPPDILDKIFEPYYSTKSMGTGIGLYMSKMIIERNMNGSLSAQNTCEGAAFTVSMPLVRESHGMV
jgi:PAS domain S-box-containing protein